MGGGILSGGFCINGRIQGENIHGVYKENVPFLGEPEPCMRSLDEALEAYEKSLISEAVEKTASLVEAAHILGITKQNLNYKMKKLGIKRR